MEEKEESFVGLNGNQLKIIALIAMTCDHVGKELLPGIAILQVIGRFAFPIFAYMIAEGCVHTKSKKKYLFTMFLMGLVCQIVYFIAEDSYYQCILITFTLSIGLIFTIDYARKSNKILPWIVCVVAFLLAVFLCVILPWMLSETDFYIDYGIFGVLLPVCVYLGTTREKKLIGMTVPLLFLAMYMEDIQWYALLTPFLMALYNGKRGKWRMKNLFYIYYPLHLVVIYLIGLVIL